MTHFRTAQSRLRVGVFLCALAGHLWRATAQDYLVDVWTGENGLPSSSVTAIAQTPEGYLWVGSYNGLSRFDGVRFVTFDPENTPALQRARVRRLFVDDTGILWINTYDGSLTSYRGGRFQLEWKGDGSADSNVSLVSGRPGGPIFLLYDGELIQRRAFARQKADEQSVTNAGVEQTTETNLWRILHPPGASSGSLCVEDSTGVLWGRGRDQKLWRFRDGHFEMIPTNPGLQGTQIHCLAADGAGKVWIGTEKELATAQARGAGVEIETVTPTNGEATLDVNFLQLTMDGKAWVVANDRLRKAQGRRWVNESELCRGVFTGWLGRMGMLEEADGGTWFYHYGKGIFHVRQDNTTSPIAKEAEFPGERIDCLFRDREGSLWSGVDRGGLVRLRPKRFTTVNPQSRHAAAASSVAEDSSGALWVGSYGVGLQCFQNDTWQHIPVPDDSRRSYVFSICPDATQRVWVSAGDEDLYVREGGVFHLATPAVHGIKALLAGRDGRLWLGTKTGLRCWSEGQLRTYREEDGVPRSDFRALAETSDGTLWAGGDDGVLYHVLADHAESFRPPGALAGQPIIALLAEEDGTIWAGTFRGGLLRFRDHQFNRFTTKDGLPNNVISQVLKDDMGRLWLGSQQGIFWVAKSNLQALVDGSAKTLNCTAYGRYNGLPSIECSFGYQPAACRTRDGRLLFSTLKGVVAVQPASIEPNRLPPPLVIEDVAIDGKTRQVGELASSAGSAMGSATPLVIPAGTSSMELRYTGLSFISPDRVRFRYRLVGVDKDVVEAGTRRSAQYSFLRPGHYTFEVTACNNDGTWNPQWATLPIFVQPYFYETWWFPWLTALVSLALVAVGVRQVVSLRLRRQLEGLERQRAIDRDRARIARDIHDDLGAGLTQIALLSELARREPKGVELMERISSCARKLTRGLDEIVWAADPQHDTLSGLMDYISAFTEDFLRTAGIRCRMQLPAQLPALPVSAEARYNLFLAVKETLNNIVKHSRATEVRLRLHLEADGLQLTIEDNGHGLPASNGNAVFCKAEEAASNGTNRGPRHAGGKGLPNLEQRLALIGGHCLIRSSVGGGTAVEMQVRLNGASGASPVMASSRNGNGLAE